MIGNKGKTLLNVLTSICAVYISIKSNYRIEKSRENKTSKLLYQSESNIHVM